MSTEVVQTEQRKANLEAIERLGFAAYPNKFDTTHTVSQLVEGYSAKTAAELESPRVDTIAAGRVMSVRSFGKASFFVLSDGRSRIQVYVRQDALSERDYALSKLLDIGDQIGVSGHLFRTKTNELSIWAASLQFLAKCFLPLPEKWHGLQDVEIRYRQRYLDLIVNPDVRRVFEIRTHTVEAIRQFLNGHGFMEVETPMMQKIAGGALARPF
ncbi:MAG TPA: amino acid--tRNA ligase-related protein, partial [Vicinamibacterales bacterium]